MKRFLFVILGLSIITCTFAQAVTKNGQITTTTSTYVNPTGAVGAGTGVNKNGQIISAALAIGDSYQGGKIFYFFVAGDPGYVAGEVHGLIAANADVGGQNIPWGCQNTDIPGTVSGKGYGSQNTTIILNTCTSGGIAAKICADYVDGIYSDWYLPSRDEVTLLYQNRGILGGFDSRRTSSGGWPFYWSSTQQDSYYAIGMRFDINSSFGLAKSNTYRVRPIRTF